MDTQPKKSFFKKFWWLLVIAIIIIAIIGAGLIMNIIGKGQDEYQEKQQNKETGIANQNVNTNSSLTNPKFDTADWLTYRNEVAKFELKYPPKNWKIEVAQGEDPETVMAPGFWYCGYLEGHSYLDFYVYDYTVEEGTTPESRFVILDLVKILEQKRITIDNEEAAYTKFLRESYEEPQEIIDVIHNLRPYRILPGPEPEEPCETDLDRKNTYREIQDAILSTFKFID